MGARRRLYVETGQRFGRGVVIDPEVKAPRRDRPGGERGARLLCDCGIEYVALLGQLLRGSVVSCGCQRSEKAAAHMRHLRGVPAGSFRLPPAYGLRSHPLFDIWRGMLDRCENPGNKRYQRYGARGITVCARWHDVRLFIQDIEREIGAKPARCPECGGRYSLDRIDNRLGYYPGNIRWATATEQNLNKG